ncbi:recombinase family protein [Rubellimicrobium aerolatum]|uniref:Recombinase family protein n=1 Tax=Rubellimicrobium aerolatum TaxID=490979 RepID=A0ABW0SHH7_9RHOB|nr:hypothetical protein [Rubellimicrobium aerolatum]
MRGPGEVVVKDPDLEVQARLGLVFESFLRLRSAVAAIRCLKAQDLDLPRRDRHGDLRWTRRTVAAVTTILKNPAYAGAFVYGRKRMAERTSRGGRQGKAPRAMADWRIVVKDRHPPYIDWPTFEGIQATLTDNRAEYMQTKTRGAPREGDLLLQGLAWCGRCGHKMSVRTKGSGSTSATACAPNRACLAARACALPRSKRRWGGPSWPPSRRLSLMRLLARTARSARPTRR